MASYISGIDVGHMAIRAVVLKKRGDGWKIHEHGSVERFYGSSGEKSLHQELAELSTKVQLRGPVYFTDSTMSVMVRFIASVPLPEDRLRRLVHLDLEQHADDSGDLAADMYVLPIGGDEVISCCALAQPKQVSDMLSILQKNRINPQAVTIPAAALYNVSREAFKEEDGYHLVIEVGAEATRLVVMRGPDFIGCRSIPVGGRQFTQALADSQKRNFKDAEKLKMSGLASKSSIPGISEPMGEDTDTRDTFSPSFNDSDSDEESKLFDDDSNLFSDEQAEEDKTAENEDELSFTAFDEDKIEIDEDILVDEPKNEAAESSRNILADNDVHAPKPGSATQQIGAQQLGQEMVQVAEQLHMQILSSLKWFNSQLHMPKLKIDTFAICGGGSKLSGLRLYLEHRLGKELNPFNPIAHIESEGIQDAQDYAIAIGAALQADNESLQLDVRPESMLRKEIFYSEVIWPRVAAGFLLVATILFAISMHLGQAANADATEVYRLHEEQRQNEVTQLEALQAERETIFEDLRGIAGRIYAGRDLLNSIRAFKEKAPQDLWIITFRTQGIIDEGNVDIRNNDDRNDTAIDRGSIFVSGRVKSVKNTKVSDYQKQFDMWWKNILNWQDPDKHRLFKKAKVEKLRQLEKEEDKDQPYVFEMRFDFEPTSLNDVAQLVDKHKVEIEE